MMIFCFLYIGDHVSRLDRIYTGVGDKGMTCLGTGRKVLKSSSRIEAYGTVDELNSWVGLVLQVCSKEDALWSADLERVQNHLFDIGGELSVPGFDKVQVLDQGDINFLEKKMDEVNEKLPPLENFVLPGGDLRNAYLHMARTVCRRAERCVVSLGCEEDVRDVVRVYLNRLSDWFFVMSRWCCVSRGVREVLWSQRKQL
ncbi:MAG: cob(I)yrinic acid a,c-diamide adenosyltransferase [Oligoflexales bacterium]